MKNEKSTNFEKATCQLLKILPKEETTEVVHQEFCEYEIDFLGFVDIYKSVSSLIPSDWTVIDFGCNFAAQSYFFEHCKEYIGVDVVKGKRFSPSNAVHFSMTIQEYIKQELPILLAHTKMSKIFAICSYVPDEEAVELVRKTFKNVFCFYPS